MNIIEMIARIEYHTDKVNAPRFTRAQHYIPSLNIAIDDYVKDRYDNIKTSKNYAFQLAQRVRDELRSLVQKDIPITPIGSLIPFPADYRHEVALSVFIDGMWQSSRPITYNEKDVLIDNTFQEPEAEHPVHIEDSNGITVEAGDVVSFTNSRLSYLRNPAQVAVSDSISASGAALTPGNLYYVEVGPVTSASTTYQTGDSFTAFTAALFGTGTVLEIVNCDLPSNSHEEIVRIAVDNLIGSVEDYNKSKFIELQTEKN